MRISDWSSDVCSSDLPAPVGSRPAQTEACRDLSGKSALLQIAYGRLRLLQFAQVMRLRHIQHLLVARDLFFAAFIGRALPWAARLLGHRHANADRKSTCLNSSH